MKNSIILVIFLILSSCSVNKTFYENGIIQTKTSKTDKRQKTKYFDKKGRLLSINKSRKSNLKRTLSDGKVLKEQIIKSEQKGFYNTGFRKKKFTYSRIFTDTDNEFVYQFDFLEYTEKRNLIRQIKFKNYNGESKFSAKSKKNEKIEISSDTILQYINKVIHNKSIY